MDVDTAAGKTGGLLLFLQNEHSVAFLFTGVIHCAFTVAGCSTTTIFVNPVSLLNKMSEAHDLSVQLCTDVQT